MIMSMRANHKHYNIIAIREFEKFTYIHETRTILFPKSDCHD